MSTIIFTKEGGLFDFDLTFFSVLIEILLLYAFLQFFLFKPVLNIIEYRRQAFNSGLLEANRVLTESDRMNSEYELLVSLAQSTFRSSYITFDKLSDELFTTQFQTLGQEINELVNQLNRSLFSCMPLYAGKISSYSFENEELALEKRLLE